MKLLVTYYDPATVKFVISRTLDRVIDRSSSSAFTCIVIIVIIYIFIHTKCSNKK